MVETRNIKAIFGFKFLMLPCPEWVREVVVTVEPSVTKKIVTKCKLFTGKNNLKLNNCEQWFITYH